METLEKTLRQSHDWAIDRIHTLSEEKQYANVCAIKCEFNEWLDPNIDEHDIISLEYIGN